MKGGASSFQSGSAAFKGRTPRHANSSVQVRRQFAVHRTSRINQIHVRGSSIVATRTARVVVRRRIQERLKDERGRLFDGGVVAFSVPNSASRKAINRQFLYCVARPLSYANSVRGVSNGDNRHFLWEGDQSRYKGYFFSVIRRINRICKGIAAIALHPSFYPGVTNRFDSATGLNRRFFVISGYFRFACVSFL